jgi:hypothetical protein
MVPGVELVERLGHHGVVVRVDAMGTVQTAASVRIQR